MSSGSESEDSAAGASPVVASDATDNSPAVASEEAAAEAAPAPEEEAVSSATGAEAEAADDEDEDAAVDSAEADDANEAAGEEAADSSASGDVQESSDAASSGDANESVKKEGSDDKVAEATADGLGETEAADNAAPAAVGDNAEEDGTAAPAPEEVAPAEPKIELLYTPPPWSTPPQTPYYFEVREGEDVVEKVPVNIKGHYLIGRLPICDIVVDDATCSRQHAVVQFRPGDPDPQTGKRQDEVYIYDLGSTSGTYVNGMPLQAKAYYPLYKGDILQFGQYSCAFVMRDGSEPGVIPPDGVASGGDTTKSDNAERGDSFDLAAKNIDPRSANFDEDAYKQAMIEKYMMQQRENEEILKRRKERLAQGLAPEDADYVPEVKPVATGGAPGTPGDKKGKKGKKGKKDKEECIIS